jgi:hypothetical protein
MSTSIISPAVVVARPYPGGFMPSSAGSWHRVSPVVSSAANAVDAFPARQSVPAVLTAQMTKPATRAMDSARLAYDAKQAKGAQPPRGTPR